MTRYPKSGKGKQWTTRELAAVPAAWKGDTLSDGGGLSGEVRVAADGRVSVRFKFAFRWDGRLCWYQCGTWPGVDLAEIRRNRDAARLQVAQGINPAQAKEAARIEKQRAIAETLAANEQERQERLTVADLFTAWLADGVNRKDGNEGLRRYYGKDIAPRLGALEFRELQEGHIRAMLKPTVAAGKVRTAQVLLLIVRQALSWAEKRQPWRPLLIAGNPADLITEDSITPPDYKSERERVLSPAEIQELAQVLTKPDPRPLKAQTQCALWVLLGTICRVGELLHARWEDVDLKAGVWFIPEENVKGRRGQRQAQKVALSPFVLRHFRQLHALTGAGPWCFPASTPGTSAEGAGPVGINTISKQIADRQAMFSARAVALQHRRNDNTLVLAGGKNGKWTPHDLRRTGATMMQALGVGLEIIDRCQNHVLAGSKVRRHYLHYDYAEEKARAWNLLGERLEGILSGGAEILPIKRRA